MYYRLLFIMCIIVALVISSGKSYADGDFDDGIPIDDNISSYDTVTLDMNIKYIKIFAKSRARCIDKGIEKNKRCEKQGQQQERRQKNCGQLI